MGPEKKISRRNFLKVVVTAVGGILLASCVDVQKTGTEVPTVRISPIDVLPGATPGKTDTAPVVVAPTVPPTMEVTAVVPKCEPLANLETLGIGSYLTVTPLSEVGLQAIGGYEKLRPSLIAAVDNLALEFTKKISIGFTDVVVPEYAFEQVSKDVAVLNDSLGTKMRVVKYDPKDAYIFKNFTAMWIVPFVSENGGGLAKDKDGNEAIMMRNISSVEEHVGGKLKPTGEVYVFSKEKDANGQDVTNVRPIPLQAEGGILDVAVGCDGTKLVKVDATGKLVEVMVDNPVIYPVPGIKADVWKVLGEVAVGEPTEEPRVEYTGEVPVAPAGVSQEEWNKIFLESYAISRDVRVYVDKGIMPTWYAKMNTMAWNGPEEDGMVWNKEFGFAGYLMKGQDGSLWAVRNALHYSRFIGNGDTAMIDMSNDQGKLLLGVMAKRTSDYATQLLYTGMVVSKGDEVDLSKYLIDGFSGLDDYSKGNYLKPEDFIFKTLTLRVPKLGGGTSDATVLVYSPVNRDRSYILSPDWVDTKTPEEYYDSIQVGSALSIRMPLATGVEDPKYANIPPDGVVKLRNLTGVFNISLGGGELTCKTLEKRLGLEHLQLLDYFIKNIGLKVLIDVDKASQDGLVDIPPSIKIA